VHRRNPNSFKFVYTYVHEASHVLQVVRVYTCVHPTHYLYLYLKTVFLLQIHFLIVDITI
jgi:hypothetical protein